MNAAPNDVVVMLGASNLARGLAPALAQTRARLGPGARVLMASGRGRSFGIESKFTCRRLPSVLDCGLWRALDRPATHALICDVGNDLAYGVEPARVLEWVERCLERLPRARAVVCGMPIATLERLPLRQMRVWSRVIYPQHPFDPLLVLERARELAPKLHALAVARGATWVDLDPRWYGLDPIHFAALRSREAWRTVLSGLGGADRPVERDLGFRLRVPFLVPEYRTWWGRPQRGEQPCHRFRDGTTLELY